MKKSIIIFLVASSLGLVIADELDHDDAFQLRQAGEILSLEKVIEQAQDHHSGKILEAELEKENGMYIYEIEVLKQNGVIWEMKFNAKDGSLLSEEQD